MQRKKPTPNAIVCVNVNRPYKNPMDLKAVSYDAAFFRFWRQARLGSCRLLCSPIYHMETKDVILELRNKAGLSQEELAEKVYVARQAVSRWEKGGFQT